MVKEIDFFKRISQAINDAIIIVDKDKKILSLNGAAEETFEYKSKELLGNSINLIIPGLKNSDFKNAEKKSKNDQHIKILQAHFKKSNSELIEATISGLKIKKDRYFILIVRDISSKKKRQERLRYVTFHDNLTGLFNRLYFHAELNRLNTARQLPLSVIMGDIDGFKLANDAFGYDYGDVLLKQVANILKESCRADDIVARWGGDEFVILLPKTDSNMVMDIINRIEKRFVRKYKERLPISISLGFSVRRSIEKEIDYLMVEAENNMKKAKILKSKKVNDSILDFLEKSLWKKKMDNRADREAILENCLKLAKLIKLPSTDRERLKRVVTFHDIGELAIEEDIIGKKKNLKESELFDIRSHPEVGYRIAKTSPNIADIAECILYHHERWDGKGYPHGIKGKKIPLLARIISIVTAFDSMVSGRKHKKKISLSQALEELKKCAGTQFDPKLTDRFISIFESEKAKPSPLPGI